MGRLLIFFLILFLSHPPSSECTSSIVGSWQFKNDQLEIVAEFFQDGTFRQVNSTLRMEANSRKATLTFFPSKI
jgi:hypothetical protein